MKHLSISEARELALKQPRIMEFFRLGYSEVLQLSNTKVMNDNKVKSNDYWVNENFESDPQWFIAHRSGQNPQYLVLPAIYLLLNLRGKGVGGEIMKEVQEKHCEKDRFLQVAVKLTKDTKFEKLDSFYKKLCFQRINFPIHHGNDIYFYDYFWAHGQFRVIQDRVINIRAKFI